MEFNQLLQHLTLNAKATMESVHLSDQLLTKHVTDQAVSSGKLKQVCFPITPALYDEFHEVTEILGISKRKFCEAALVEALKKAREVMDEIDIFESVPASLMPPKKG